MKQIIFTFLSFFITLFTANAQDGINFSRGYGAGGKQLMFVDSSAKAVFYWNVYPNQPNTSFNYLPDVNNVGIRIYFRKDENIEQYRYTILVDNKPIAVNKTIKKEQLAVIEMEEGLLSFATLGIFPLKGKVITTLIYNVEKPLAIEKCIFYGKSIPKAKIKELVKRFAVDKGINYTQIIDPKEKTNLVFTEKDDELTIVKDKSDIDYIYYASIKDKKTNKVIFESTSWQYGGYVDNHEFLPFLKVDKSVFKKSGNYEIVIQPFIKGNTSFTDIEKYTSRYTLSISLDQENYSKKEVLIYTLVVASVFGLVFLGVLYFIKKRNKKKLAEKEQQKNIAKLKLNSIRSQLNPHFLFNALSGIQNLMNKNEIDNANKYLSKFARLTRNVLDDKELISLSQEKTLLDDYLQMEQLRFGFNYEINSAENLDLDNIEIPSMLLQPFVENAVKHGISQKATDGKITITFIKQTKDLILTVTDNGNGFDIDKRDDGLGLLLSDSRVDLLNSIYKENRFTLDIQSTTNGTKIRLLLSDWL